MSRFIKHITVEAPPSCVHCGTQLSPQLLMCPGCRRLIHAQRLQAIAADADAYVASGTPAAALALWREALDLVPPQSQQYRILTQRVDELSRAVDGLPAAERERQLSTLQQKSANREAAKSVNAEVPTSSPDRTDDTTARRGLIGIVIAIGIFLLTKGKLLLVGLTKSGTFLSMLAAFGVYWAAFGWKFALGLVLSIYIHEMGHVAALVRYGIPATAPMFIPGIGAVIRLKQHLPDARQDARVGLAGPVWGTGAAIAANAVSFLTGWSSWAAIAQVGAWINLFNLMPLGPLDGGRAFAALDLISRRLCLAVIAMMFLVSQEGLLLLIGAMTLFRAFGKNQNGTNDGGTLVVYLLLVVTLTLMTMIPVALPS